MRGNTGQIQTGVPQDNRPDEGLDEGSDLSVTDVLHMLVRQRWFIVICTILCILIAFIYTRVATPIYQATATMRIDPSRASSLGLNDLISGGSVSDPDSVMKTEIAILESDAVAIDTLNSLTDEQYKRYTGMDKQSSVIPQGATVLTPAQENLLAEYKASLSAKQAEGTQIVGVTFNSPKPDVAAYMANRAIEAYLRQSFDSRYGSVAQVSKWLSAEMDSLKERASEAQRKLAAFQEKNSILGADAANNTTIDRLRLLNNRLAEAQADRIVKEAQMRAALTGNPAVLAAMFPSPSLAALEASQGSLYAQYAQLSSKFGSNWPALVDLKAQMQKVDAEVSQQIGTVRNRIQQDYDAALSTERMLQSQYDDQAQRAFALNRDQAEYAVLQAEGNSSRDLYDTLQYKLQQAGVDAGLNAVNTMLVDTARTPRTPVEPKKRLVLAFGLILGLFAGAGSAFVREAASDTVQSPEQIERVTHRHVLAIIPHLSFTSLEGNGVGNATSGRAKAMLPTYNDPVSRGAEAYRSLRNSVLLTSIDRPSKTILVTSTLPGEGKSSTAANFAIVLAQRNARVLLIDADLRRPTLHTRFGIPNRAGLCDLILGEEAEDPFLSPFDDLPNLSLLPAGRRTKLSSETLSSAKYRALLEEWESTFDYVVIDSAPILVVSDTLPMASWVDTVIVVARYHSTPFRGLKRTLAILRRANANVAGIVINDISYADARYGGYDYGYGGYYTES